MDGDTWSVLAAAFTVVAATFAYLSWRDSRPFEPFEVSHVAEGVFGLRCTRASRVVIDKVWVPHHGPLHQSDESAWEGPWSLRRGQQIHLYLAGGVEAPVDVAVEWRRGGPLGRLPGFGRTRHWGTHVLPS